MKVLLATDGSEPALRACHMIAGMLVPERDEVRVLTVLSYHVYPHALVPGEHLVGERAIAEQ
ncbi:MAG: universal stress protein, partial [Actinomycetota bacterium]